MAQNLTQEEFNKLVEKYSVDVNKDEYVTIKSSVLHQFVKDTNEVIAYKYKSQYGMGLRIGSILAKFSKITPDERIERVLSCSNYMDDENIYIDTKLNVKQKQIYYQTRVEPYDINKFLIKSNEFLQLETIGYYHTDYKHYKEEGNPDYINVLKNQYDNTNHIQLEEAAQIVKTILDRNLPAIKQMYQEKTLRIVTVPRSKSIQEEWFQWFRKTISEWVNSHINMGFENGCYDIIRVKDTFTTHSNLSSDIDPKPYVGITKNTCTISQEIAGRDILLIDDIFTPGVNIDEDAIQALHDNKAKSVMFYSIAKTQKII